MHRETRVANYILATLSALSLVLMSLPLSAPVASVKACLSYAFNPVAYYGSKGIDRLSGAPSNVARLIAADVHNRALIEEMSRWNLAKAEMEALRKENARLKDLLGLKLPQGRTPIWAQVMERDPLHWYHSITVNAGSDEGVVLNAPVLGQKGEKLIALGRITEVGPKSSKVLLLTDELSSAAAYLSSSTAVLNGAEESEGLVQGQGAPRLLMNYLQSEAVLYQGDWAYTSATSATFPPDILIGQVDKVHQRDPFLTFQSVEIKPAADASSFREVMILKTAAKP